MEVIKRKEDDLKGTTSIIVNGDDIISLLRDRCISSVKDKIVIVYKRSDECS